MNEKQIKLRDAFWQHPCGETPSEFDFARAKTGRTANGTGDANDLGGPNSSMELQAMIRNRVKLFGVQIDVVDMRQAVNRITGWFEPANGCAEGASESRQGGCRFVVTPNVDHTVLLNKNSQFGEVYRDADLVLADGWPIVLASKLLGKPLPERVAGSDLVPALFDTTKGSGRPLRVYLLGAAEGVADRAAMKIQDRWPNVQIVGTYSPPIGFEKSGAENVRILKKIAVAEPDVLVVGLGAPKQELWVHKHRKSIRANAALCVGATIDFLAGEKKRAPKWVQTIRCEWVYRMVSDPKRLVKRYANDAFVFPQLFAREWVKR